LSNGEFQNENKNKDIHRSTIPVYLISDSQPFKHIFNLSIVALIFFFISFSFIFNFPEYIADPIRDFTNSMKEIGKQNYKKHLHHDSNDEFGELATAFNNMAEQLEAYALKSKIKSLTKSEKRESVVSGKKDASRERR
jgi:nitrogen fixation/metabolism regulation signal transduction histidine kinase